MPTTQIIGLQRLSEAANAASVLARAVDSGVQWVDVADVYGTHTGDAERLVAAHAGAVGVVTKGGLVRTKGRWRTDGRAKHLIAAAEASRDRLNVDAIDLYLLHAPDPRTPWTTSVRALAKLVDRGVIRAAGVSNVTVGQLRIARDHVDVAAVQMALSPFDPISVRCGVVEACREAGIPLLAHRPLGGDKVGRLRRDPTLAALSEATGATAEDLVLAWLRTLGVIPVPGPTRPETVDACLHPVILDDAAREALDTAFGWSVQLRRARSDRAPPTDGDDEIRMVMGSPGAGKSTLVRTWEADGWIRLNRDDRKTTLPKLVRVLDGMLTDGARRVVLDNTNPDRATRNAFLETAWAHGLPVRLSWLQTGPEDCERNVINRILDAIGRLPEPEEMGALNRKDPGVVPPRALLRYRDALEAPELEEGFASIEEVPFVRGATEGRPALVCDVRHLDELPDLLRARVADGRRLVVIAWAPGGDRATEVARIQARAASLGLHALVGVCPHPPGPPVCWCRKPWIGLVVALAREHDLDLDRLEVVVTSPADRTFAQRLTATQVLPDEADPSDGAEEDAP